MHPCETLVMVPAGNMTSSINSNGADLSLIAAASIQAVWTGSPVGTLKLQVSNDLVNYAGSSNPSASVTNWSDLSGSSTSVSGSGDFTWNLTSAGYRWVRLVYTASSGSGTLNANYCGKG